MSEEKECRYRDYEKEFDENKHLPSSDLEYEKNAEEDCRYYVGYDGDDGDDGDDDDGDDGDGDDDDIEPYNFSDYVDLLSVTEYVDNPDLDKITNIILALIKANNILSCKETSFSFDFEYGEYNKWIETAKLFNENIENENIEYCNNYRILIDEGAIVCKLLD